MQIVQTLFCDAWTSFSSSLPHMVLATAARGNRAKRKRSMEWEKDRDQLKRSKRRRDDRLVMEDNSLKSIKDEEERRRRQYSREN